MFTIEDKEIFVTMGDTAIITLELNVDFSEGDIAYLTLKKKKNQNSIDFQTVARVYKDNTCKFYLESQDTYLPEGKYFYDIQISFADGRVCTVINCERFIIGGEICSETNYR